MEFQEFLVRVQTPSCESKVLVVSHRRAGFHYDPRKKDKSFLRMFTGDVIWKAHKHALLVSQKWVHIHTVCSRRFTHLSRLFIHTWVRHAPSRL